MIQLNKVILAQCDERIEKTLEAIRKAPPVAAPPPPKPVPAAQGTQAAAQKADQGQQCADD
jgi:hypothetical protein